MLVATTLLLSVLVTAPFTPLDGTFTVTASGITNYIINGSPDPTLQVERGGTYTFNINALGHPFWIKTAASTGSANRYDVGVTNNGDDSGTITWVVAMDAPNTLFYNCGLHSTMTGQINVVNPAGVGGHPVVTSMRIAPNPARGHVSFVLSSDLTAGVVEVLDLSGRRVARIDGSNSTEWDGRGEGSDLAPGMYVARAIGASGAQVTRRFLWLGR
jgi:hypothetical protein